MWSKKTQHTYTLKKITWESCDLEKREKKANKFSISKTWSRYEFSYLKRTLTGAARPRIGHPWCATLSVVVMSSNLWWTGEAKAGAETKTSRTPKIPTKARMIHWGKENFWSSSSPATEPILGTQPLLDKRVTLPSLSLVSEHEI